MSPAPLHRNAIVAQVSACRPQPIANHAIYMFTPPMSAKVFFTQVCGMAWRLCHDLMETQRSIVVLTLRQSLHCSRKS